MQHQSDITSFGRERSSRFKMKGSRFGKRVKDPLIQTCHRSGRGGGLMNLPANLSVGTKKRL